MTPPDDFNPVVGDAVLLEPGLRRIVAPNPSPMTYRGTNTYIVGTRGLAVIDPGPDNAAHLVAGDSALRHANPAHQPYHCHPCASGPFPTWHGACRDTPTRLYLRTGMRTAGAQCCDGTSALPLATKAAVKGIDAAFQPDLCLADGAHIEGHGWMLEALHTPGHIGNHLCLAWGDACLTADHVMGWASSLVSPPDGDLTDFHEVLRDTANTSLACLLPWARSADSEPVRAS